MNEKNLKITIIIIIALLFFLIVSWMFFVNRLSYKLKTLYNNPIKINEKYQDFIYDEYKDHVTILSYDGSDQEVIVPEKINNKPVYSIDDSAFYANPNLEKVIIPKNVIRIGHQTFIGNANLKEVILPDNIIDIGGWAFDGCPKLESIYVKKGSKTEKILQKLPFEKYIIYK